MDIPYEFLRTADSPRKDRAERKRSSPRSE